MTSSDGGPIILQKTGKMTDIDRLDALSKIPKLIEDYYKYNSGNLDALYTLIIAHLAYIARFTPTRVDVIEGCLKTIRKEDWAILLLRLESYSKYGHLRSYKFDPANFWTNILRLYNV